MTLVISVQYAAYLSFRMSMTAVVICCFWTEQQPRKMFKFEVDMTSHYIVSQTVSPTKNKKSTVKAGASSLAFRQLQERNRTFPLRTNCPLLKSLV
jgi:hypothetical protein